MFLRKMGLNPYLSCLEKNGSAWLTKRARNTVSMVPFELLESVSNSEACYLGVKASRYHQPIGFRHPCVTVRREDPYFTYILTSNGPMRISGVSGKKDKERSGGIVGMARFLPSLPKAIPQSLGLS